MYTFGYWVKHMWEPDTFYPEQVLLKQLAQKAQFRTCRRTPASVLVETYPFARAYKMPHQNKNKGVSLWTFIRKDLWDEFCRERDTFPAPDRIVGLENFEIPWPLITVLFTEWDVSHSDQVMRVNPHLVKSDPRISTAAFNKLRKLQAWLRESDFHYREEFKP